MTANGHGQHKPDPSNPFEALIAHAMHDQLVHASAQTARINMSAALQVDYAEISQRATQNDWRLREDAASSHAQAITIEMAAAGYVRHRLASKVARNIAVLAIDSGSTAEFKAQALEHKAQAERWLMRLSQLAKPADG